MEPVPQRIGDAERDRAVESLREHHAAGRLDLDEFNDRMQTALSARVSSDLTPSFADLPGATFSPSQGLAAIGSAATPAPVPVYAAAWTEADERDLRAAEQRGRWMNLVQGLAWPAVLIVNFAFGFAHFWWMFMAVALVLGPLHSHVNDGVKRLKKRRREALGLPAGEGAESSHS